jgi:hypothetical protein
MNDRQTGRTTEMLQRAAEAKKEGRHVLIVVHDATMIGYCRMACNHAEIHGLVERDFTSISSCIVKMRGMSYKNIFVDHHVYEIPWTPEKSRFMAELEMCRRCTGG